MYEGRGPRFEFWLLLGNTRLKQPDLHRRVAVAFASGGEASLACGLLLVTLDFPDPVRSDVDFQQRRFVIHTCRFDNPL